MDCFLAYSLLIDPVHVWRDGIEPFTDTTHPDHWWARDHHEPHFALVDGAPARHDDLLKAFRADAGPLDGPKAIEALTNPARLLP
jgi:hypothetical protein